MSTQALLATIRIAVGEGATAFSVTADVALDEGLLVFFGPSGAGKSLVLQGLAGLVRPESGQIQVRGDVLLDTTKGIDIPPHRRQLGYVPQHHSLFPFCDVLSNILFGLPRPERKRTNPSIVALMEELGISHLASAQPASLSGGERQRVALARALAVRPRLLLLDEPFAAIDYDGRAELREVLRRTLALHETPAVFITHDPQEALALGDRLLKFERGRSVGTGTPSEFLGEATA